MAPRKESRRACDPCSVRKVRCDGNNPCARCVAASYDCTYLKTHGKSGPKGPRRTTERAIRRLQEKSRNELVRPASSSSIDSESPSTIDFPLDPLPPPVGLGLDGILSETEPLQPDLLASEYPHAQSKPSRISTSSLSAYLETYQTRAYPIWPVVDTDQLIARLLTEPEDMEAYALATSVCAATITQFQTDGEPASPLEAHLRIPSSAFEAEAKRARMEFDHQERMTLWSLLGSFFLHVYTANIGKMSTSTILLSEAITAAHIIGLHKPSYYAPLNVGQQQHCLRIYWLLFITERAHSIQHDVPTILKRAPDLPPLDNLHDGSVTPAFIQLCHLFNILDATLSADPSNSRAALALAQQQLSRDLSAPSLCNEIERADISMTQQWMRIFLWQHALSVTNLRSTDSEDEFSFSFPAKVAQNVLAHFSSLSKASLEAHGPGMETKLFDIANSLADVMIFVPSLNQESTFSIGPRDLIHSLSSLLSSFRGGNPAVMAVLREKLGALGLAGSSPRRLIDISSSSGEEQENHDGRRQPVEWGQPGGSSGYASLIGY